MLIIMLINEKKRKDNEIFTAIDEQVMSSLLVMQINY